MSYNDFFNNLSEHENNNNSRNTYGRPAGMHILPDIIMNKTITDKMHRVHSDLI